MTTIKQHFKIFIDNIIKEESTIAKSVREKIKIIQQKERNVFFSPPLIKLYLIKFNVLSFCSYKLKDLRSKDKFFFE